MHFTNETEYLMNENAAIESLNQILERLQSPKYSGGEIEDIPSIINSIIRHSNGINRTFIRSPQMNQDILNTIILFYSRFKDKHSNESQTVNKAMRWVGDSIMDLIGNTNHNLHIPSLDALLTTMGGYNTLEFNELKREYLLGMIRSISSNDEVRGDDAFQAIFKLRQLEELGPKEKDDINQPLLSQEMEIFLEKDQSLLDLIH